MVIVILSIVSLSPYTSTFLTDDVIDAIALPDAILPDITVLTGNVTWYESIDTVADILDGTTSTLLNLFP